MGRRWTGWHLLVSVLASAGALALSLMLATGLTESGMPVIWLSTGVQVGVLLLAPRRQQPGYLLAFSAVGLAVTTLMGVALPVGLVAAAATLLTVLATVGIAGRRNREWVEGAAERMSGWLQFTAAVVLGEALGAVACAVLTVGWSGLPVAPAVLANLPTWFAGSVVATFLVVPAILRLRPARQQVLAAGRRAELVAILVVIAVLCVGTMLQPFAVLLFVLPVPLIVLLFRYGVSGVILGCGLVVPIVLVVTGSGAGPFVELAGGRLQPGLLWAQVFLVLLMVITYVITALLSEHQLRTEPRSATAISPVDYQLIAEHSGDVIIVIGDDDHIAYVSPSITPVLGWEPDELLGNPWQQGVHRADWPASQTAAQAVFANGVGRVVTARSRVRHRDGSWRWFETRLRYAPAGESGREARVVALCRDITEDVARKAELEDQRARLQEAAGTDPLTGLANRRRLDDATAEAWERAADSGQDLALLVIDVDHFKAYNDCYGHAKGDDCLVDVARAIRTVVKRPGDVAARYGGEEFVVLLPDTELDGARHVAEELAAVVRELGVPHAGSDLGVVTVSIGVAAERPGHGDRNLLFASADAALYRAKNLGRDRVEAAGLG